MATSDLYGNLEGLAPNGTAAGVLPKRSVFRFGNCFWEPWILVEVKQGERKLSENLLRFAGKLKVQHVFQVIKGLPYEDVDIFKCERPVIVPARTFAM